MYIHYSPKPKKYLQRLTFGLLMILLFTACQNRAKGTKVLLEPNTEESLFIGTPKRIIKLEMTPESALGNISKIQTDFNNDRIFVLSDFNIYIFNSVGKFITKLSKGRGPEEISMVMACSLNNNNQLLYILDNTNRICVIDYNGRFVQQVHLKNFLGTDIQAIDTERVLLQNFRISEKVPWYIVKYNLANNAIEQEFISMSESRYPEYFMITQNSFQFSSVHKTFSASNIFNLYEYKGDGFKKVIEYDLGRRSVSNSFLETMKDKQKSQFGEYASESGYVPYLLTSFCFRNYIVAILEDDERTCYVIERNSEKVYANGRLSAYLGLPDITSFSFPKEVNEDCFVFAANPTDFFEEGAKDETTIVELGDRVIEIQYEENPFLVVTE